MITSLGISKTRFDNKLTPNRPILEIANAYVLRVFVVLGDTKNVDEAHHQNHKWVRLNAESPNRVQPKNAWS